MNLNLKWTVVETTGGFGAPPIPTSEAELGTDPDGHLWRVRVKYREQEKRWMVYFDYDPEDGCSPFLRREVVYADYYWEAHRKYYHTRFVDYSAIPDAILKFIGDHDIDGVKDVAGRNVKVARG